MNRMSSTRKALAAGIGGAAALTAGWFATQRADQRAVARRPAGGGAVRAVRRRAQRRPRRRRDRALGPLVRPRRCAGPDLRPRLDLRGRVLEAADRGAQGRAPAVAFDLRGHGQSERPARSRLLDRDLRRRPRQRDRGLRAGEGERAMLDRPLARRDDDRRLGRRAPGQVDARVVCGGAAQHRRRRSDQRVARRRGPARTALPGCSAWPARPCSAPAPRSPRFTGPIASRVIRYAVTGPDASPAQVAFCEQLVLSCPADVRSAVGGTLSRLDLREALADLQAPTLVDRGRARSPDAAQARHEMAESPARRLDVIEIPRSGPHEPGRVPRAGQPPDRRARGRRRSPPGALQPRCRFARFLGPGRLAQLGERQLDKLEVTGSSPVTPIVRKRPRGGFGASEALSRWRRRAASPRRPPPPG